MMNFSEIQQTEVIDALIEVFWSGRVAVRLSPTGI